MPTYSSCSSRNSISTATTKRLCTACRSSLTTIGLMASSSFCKKQEAMHGVLCPLSSVISPWSVVLVHWFGWDVAAPIGHSSHSPWRAAKRYNPSPLLHLSLGHVHENLFEVGAALAEFE